MKKYWQCKEINFYTDGFPQEVKIASGNGCTKDGGFYETKTEAVNSYYKFHIDKTQKLLKRYLDSSDLIISNANKLGLGKSILPKIHANKIKNAKMYINVMIETLHSNLNIKEQK